MLPKLKWIKHRGKAIWSVPQFPFFTLVVRKSSYYDRFEHRAEVNLYPQTYLTLKEAQIACEQKMLELILEWNKNANYEEYVNNIWCTINGILSPLGVKIYKRHCQRYIRLMQS